MNGQRDNAFCGRSALYGCVGGETRRYTQYPGQTDPSEGGDSDRAQTIPGEDRSAFLHETEGPENGQ